MPVCILNYLNAFTVETAAGVCRTLSLQVSKVLKILALITSRMDHKDDKPLDESINTVHGEKCPVCSQPTLTLMESRRDIPYFGVVYLFSMTCSHCHYHKADLEAEEQKDPISIEFTVEKEEDMKVRFIKSADATVKIPHIMTIEPGEAANGYITNIEGLLERVKKQIEFIRDDSDDEDDKKKAKNMLKKIQNVMWGHDTLKIQVTDPTGNSAIISDRAIIKKLSGKKK